MGFSIGDLYLTLLADGGRLKQSIEQEATKAADMAGTKAGQTFGARMAASFAKTGKSLQQTGTTLTKNVTAPIVGLAAAVVAVGTEFDTTLRQITALTDTSVDEIGKVRKALLGMASEIGKDPAELARGFYFLASAGFTTSEALDVLHVAAKAAAAGLGDTADISKVVGAEVNAFGKENLTASDAVNFLLRAIKDGTAEAPDFAAALGQVLGSAAAVGAKANDVNAALAAMTLKGISADEAATSLNQVFLSLLRTTDQADEALAGLGTSADALRAELREKGLLALLADLAARFGDNETAASAVFGNVRALRGILALTGGDAAATAAVFDDVANGTANLEDAFRKTEGPGREMDRALAEIKVALITLADDVLPQFTQVLAVAVGLLHAGVSVFESLPGPVRQGIITIAGLAAALGPLLFISGKVTSGLGMLIGGFAKLRGLGAALAPAIGRAVAGLERSPVIGRAVAGLGKAMGSTLGTAASIAFAAVAVVEVVNTYNNIKDGLNRQSDKISKDIANQIKTGTTAELEKSKAAIETGIAQLNGIWDAGIFTNEQRAKLEANLDALNRELARRANLAPQQIAAGIEAGKTEVAAAAADAISTIASPLDRLVAEAKAAGRKVPTSLAQGILERQAVVPDAMDVLRNLIKNALTPAQQIARDVGILTSKQLAAGLRDKRPEVRTEAERVRSLAEQELADLIAAGGKAGKKAMAELQAGLHSKNADVRAAAKRVKAIIDGELQATEKPAGDAGKAAGTAYINGLTGALSAVTIRLLASTKGKTLERLEFRQHGGPVAAGQAVVIGEQGPEVFVPDVAGTVLPNSTIAAGTTKEMTINVYNPKPEPAGTSVRRELQKAAWLVA
jgi:TP901 family phage tail tape measure protein